MGDFYICELCGVTFDGKFGDFYEFIRKTKRVLCCCCRAKEVSHDTE